MFTASPTETTHTEARWEVYPSCDLQLAYYFREGGVLEGETVEIDAAAAQHQLEAIPQEALRGKLPRHINIIASDLDESADIFAMPSYEPSNHTLRVGIISWISHKRTLRQKRIQRQSLDGIINAVYESEYSKEEKDRDSYEVAKKSMIEAGASYGGAILALGLLALLKDSEIAGGIAAGLVATSPASLTSYWSKLEDRNERVMRANRMCTKRNFSRNPQIVTIEKTSREEDARSVC